MGFRIQNQIQSWTVWAEFLLLHYVTCAVLVEVNPGLESGLRIHGRCVNKLWGLRIRWVCSVQTSVLWMHGCRGRDPRRNWVLRGGNWVRTTGRWMTPPYGSPWEFRHCCQWRWSFTLAAAGRLCQHTVTSAFIFLNCLLFLGASSVGG